MAEYEDADDLYSREDEIKWVRHLIKHWYAYQNKAKTSGNAILIRKAIMNLFYGEGKYLRNKAGKQLSLEEVHKIIDTYTDYDQFSQDIDWDPKTQ